MAKLSHVVGEGKAKMVAPVLSTHMGQVAEETVRVRSNARSKDNSPDLDWSMP